MEVLPWNDNSSPVVPTRLERTVGPPLMVRLLVDHVTLPSYTSSFPNTDYDRALLGEAIALKDYKFFYISLEVILMRYSKSRYEVIFHSLVYFSWVYFNIVVLLYNFCLSFQSKKLNMTQMEQKALKDAHEAEIIWYIDGSNLRRWKAMTTRNTLWGRWRNWGCSDKIGLEWTGPWRIWRISWSVYWL